MKIKVVLKEDRYVLRIGGEDYDPGYGPCGEVQSLMSAIGNKLADAQRKNYALTVRPKAFHVE